MKKIAFMLSTCTILLFAVDASSMTEWIAGSGKTMKQKHVNEIMFFEDIKANGNKVISTFIFKPQDKNSKEQVEVVRDLKRYNDARKEFIQEMVEENREMICKNLFLEKLKEMDLAYVYRFRFENEEIIEEAELRARDCKN